MNIIAEDSSIKYYIMENPQDIDEFKIDNLNFFHLYGVVDYKETFKIWLRKFPVPTLIAGIKNNEIVSFIYIDPWEELPNIVYVLRAQETAERMREKKIGYKMFLLGAFFTPDMIITKPLTKKSKEFYMRIGFVEAKNMSRFRTYHALTGYLALPISKKNEHINNLKDFFTSVYL